MAATVPEDVLLEILFRVKDVPAALFRCATACKRWLGLVTDSVFLRRCWPDQDVSFFVGFFTQELDNAGIFPILTPCFTPTPRSPLGPGHRALGSFMTAVPVGLFDRAVPLTSRHGLLLVRLDTYATRGYWNPNIVDLVVCNLLTGACHILPILKFGSVFDECRWNGYAMITSPDYPFNGEPVLPSTSSFFKVVILSSYINNNDMTLHMLSSEESSWTVRTNCFDGIVQPIRHGLCSRAIVRRGTAHWLFYSYEQLYLSVLNLDMRTSHISLEDLPFRLNCYLSGDMFLTLAVNGALSLLWMPKPGTQLEIWEQQEEQPNNDGGSEWVCRKTIQLKQLHRNRESEGRELCVLGDKCGTLLVSDTLQGMYIADLETGMMEDVVYWPCKGYIIPRETVPLEVDWPLIFASQLDIR